MSSLNHPHDDQPPLQSKAPSSSRRRLIKLGAGAVPVALTLASRPVFAAGTCNTTSAWGSAILRNGVSSVQARAALTAVPDPVWSLSQLLNDMSVTGVGGGTNPWTKIYNQNFPGASVPAGQTKSTVAQAKLKVSTLFPLGVSAYHDTADNVFAYLQAHKSTSNFVTAMLVARINYIFGGTGVSQCLTSSQDPDVLGAMALGRFPSGSSSNSSWTTTNILDYLSKNGIVLP